MAEKSIITKPVAAAVGVAFVSSLAASTTAVAAENPFEAADLDNGYMLAGGHKGEEGKCGEGKCGGEKAKEGKCGGEKAEEGKCGEGKCGGKNDGPVPPRSSSLNSHGYPVEGAGLGLRRALLGPLRSHGLGPVDFMEVAPENWMNVGGRYGRAFREFTGQVPFVCHGLSLSIGGPSPLDETFLHRLRQFLDEHRIRCYSEHLSYCTDDGHLYDLMPIPFTSEAVRYVAGRIRKVQDILERRITIENVSYYAAPGAELTEIEFISAVLEESDCDLLLDVNNIYVNSINHRYDAFQFLRKLPGHRIAYGHIAGHFNEDEDLIVDTHGADVIPGVWEILEEAYRAFGVFPTLLERDFNLPPIEELMSEVEHISVLQDKWQNHDSPSQKNRPGRQQA